MLNMCTGILLFDDENPNPTDTLHRNPTDSASLGTQPDATRITSRPEVSSERSDEELRTKFRQYVAKEESWLAKNLEASRFELDGLDSVVLVLGSTRRIETVSLFVSVWPEANIALLQLLFPCIYLLLSHHFRVMCIARTRVWAHYIHFMPG
jgi:hypothetical protein